MSTAEYPDALTRRLELPAAAPGDEPEGETSAVAALVRGLRAEIGAVRAELGALRAETGAVRGDLDGLGGRVDDGAADVRRTIAEAQEREDRAATSNPAMGDTGVGGTGRTGDIGAGGRRRSSRRSGRGLGSRRRSTLSHGFARVRGRGGR